MQRTASSRSISRVTQYGQASLEFFRIDLSGGVPAPQDRLRRFKRFAPASKFVCDENHARDDEIDRNDPPDHHPNPVAL